MAASGLPQCGYRVTRPSSGLEPVRCERFGRHSGYCLQHLKAKRKEDLWLTFNAMLAMAGRLPYR